MSDNEIENIRSDQMCSDYLWYAKLCEEYAFRHLVCESAKIIRSGVEVFRWYNDGCPWDRSGDVKDTGRVLSPENTWSEFLGCYTGAWMPTFESGCGKRFSTYDADLEEMIEELRFEIACAVVEAYCARYGDELYPGVKKHKYQGKYEAGDIADRMGVLDLTWDVLNDLPVTTINVPLSEVLRLSEEFSNDPIALPEFTFADGWTKDS